MIEPIKISVEQLLQEIGALTMENKELRRRLDESVASEVKKLSLVGAASSRDTKKEMAP
jgi:regulator of replication initiation timing